MPEKDEYYRLTDTWDSEVIRSAQVQRNRAYVFALAAFAVAAAEAVALAALTPLKTVEVATVTYNDRTGIVRSVRYSDDVERITADEAFIRNQVHQFIVARETWELGDLDYRRKQVKLLLAPRLISSYFDEFNRFNKAAAINVFGAKIKRSVTVRTVSFLNPRTAHVQYVTDDDNNGAHTYTEWAAVVGFGFTKRPTTTEDGLINPFGFQVTSYRRDSMAAEPKPVEAAN